MSVEVKEVADDEPREEKPVLVLGPYEAGRVQCTFYKQREKGRLAIPLVRKRDIRTEGIDKLQLGAEYNCEKGLPDIETAPAGPPGAAPPHPG
ncbi:MAG: hypothetical protein ACLQVJ_17195 [Syntrophobacteraceae bacterium]